MGSNSNTNAQQHGPDQQHHPGSSTRPGGCPSLRHHRLVVRMDDRQQGVPAVQRNTSLVGYEARDTVAAALKGDVTAQRKVQAALDNGNTADSSSSGWCSRGPSPEMKAKMTSMVQLLAQGQLTQLETARAEFRAEMKAKWEQHCASNGGGCRSRCGGGSCNKSTNSASETDKQEAPLQGSLSKDDETLKTDAVKMQM